MDCKSADECDPDDYWIGEAAMAALEANKIKSKSKRGNLHNRTLLFLLNSKVSYFSSERQH